MRFPGKEVYLKGYQRFKSSHFRMLQLLRVLVIIESLIFFYLAWRVLLIEPSLWGRELITWSMIVAATTFSLCVFGWKEEKDEKADM